MWVFGVFFKQNLFFFANNLGKNPDLGFLLENWKKNYLPIFLGGSKIFGRRPPPPARQAHQRVKFFLGVMVADYPPPLARPIRG